MKLTKSKLVKMVKQELKEFTTTSGGGTATKRADTSAQTLKTRRKVVPSKKSYHFIKKIHDAY